MKSTSHIVAGKPALRDKMFDDRSAIQSLVINQEAAIKQRGNQFWELYIKCRDLYVNSTGGKDIIQTDTVILLKRYLMSTAVIAADARLSGDKVNRDKAAQSCAILVAGLDYDLPGLSHDPTEILKEVIVLEDLWIRMLHQEGLVKNRQWIVYLVLLAALVIAALWWVQ